MSTDLPSAETPRPTLPWRRRGRRVLTFLALLLAGAAVTISLSEGGWRARAGNVRRTFDDVRRSLDDWRRSAEQWRRDHL